MRAILGLPPDGSGFNCAECGAAANVDDAATIKSVLVTDILFCQGEVVDLFIDPGVPGQAVPWLRRFGYGPGAAVGLIDAARRLGLLDGEGPSLRVGGARCSACYLRRTESYVGGHEGIDHV